MPSPPHRFRHRFVGGGGIMYMALSYMDSTQPFQGCKQDLSSCRAA